MADRRDYFFKQKVTEAELDVGFDTLEQAERNFSIDLGFTGIVKNGVVTENSPQDLQVLVTGPLTARSPLGERLTFVPTLTVDLGTDGNLPVGAGGTGDGVSTAVVGGSNERWIGIFMVFDRILSDPRTDGNGLTVNFVRTESFHFVIVAGAEAAAPIPIASAPATPAGAIRYADVRLAFGQTQIANADIDLTNRDVVIRGPASEISVVDTFPNLDTPVSNVQETLEAHIAQIEDPHGPDNTFSGQTVLGRTGVPEPATVRVLEGQFESSVPENLALHDVGEEISTVPFPQGGSGIFGFWGTAPSFLARINIPAGATDLDSVAFQVSEVQPALPNSPALSMISAAGMIGQGVLSPGPGIAAKLHLVPGIPTGPEADFYSGLNAAKVFDVQIHSGSLLTETISGITAVLGNIVATAGSMTAQTGMTSNTGGIRATTGEVEGLGFKPTDNVTNVTLTATQAARVGKGQQVASLVHSNSAGSIQGAADINIASIVKNGTGDYTVNFDRNHGSATNYGINLTLDGGGAGQIAIGTVAIGSVQVLTFDSSGVATDRGFRLTTFGILV